MGRAFEYRRAAKEKRWDKMSKVFPKLAKAIQMAARDGGADPEMNGKLRAAIQNAKAENMPKDNIDNAIKRAVGKDAEAIDEVTFEGKGPHGVLVFVECATDNNNRTVANIKSYFSKLGGGMVPTGSLEFMFSRKAVFEIDENEGDVYVYGDYVHFGTLSKGLEDLGVAIKKASLQRIPTTPVEYSEEQLVEIEKLLDKIEEDDDVQAVYTNIA
jgi:transcriptional/translational regulatory protein YebC/TACO1